MLQVSSWHLPRDYSNFLFFSTRVYSVTGLFTPASRVAPGCPSCLLPLVIGWIWGCVQFRVGEASLPQAELNQLIQIDAVILQYHSPPPPSPRETAINESDMISALINLTSERNPLSPLLSPVIWKQFFLGAGTCGNPCGNFPSQKLD